MELDLDAFDPPPPARAPALSTYPPVLLDIAVVVDETVPAADVLAAVRAGAGELLESVRLFDVYTDDALRAAGRSRSAFVTKVKPD